MEKGMMDNGKVNDNHQEGISRKTQRSGDLKKGQGGKMGEKSHAEWKRSDAKLTPRKA